MRTDKIELDLENDVGLEMEEIDSGMSYMVGVWVIGVVSFIAIWIYAFKSWGFLIGLAIGWLPALIGGFIFGYLWPLVILAAIGVYVLSSWTDIYNVYLSFFI